MHLLLDESLSTLEVSIDQGGYKHLSALQDSSYNLLIRSHNNNTGHAALCQPAHPRDSKTALQTAVRPLATPAAYS